MGIYWKYQRLGEMHKLELKKFKAAFGRCRRGKSPSFGFTVDFEGFSRFMEEVGRIPEDMMRPSLGRKDHSIGYEPGNIFWQELSENCAENGYRSGSKAGKANLGRTLSAAHKSAISESMKLKRQGAF